MKFQFSESVGKELGNYVYRLIDPRNGETFYVGKGRGNRLFAHVADALKLEEDEDATSTKLARIAEIRRSGLDVLHVIHRHGIPDNAVFEVEGALIDAYPGLDNIARGHGSADRGPMRAEQIIDKYELPEIAIEPSHRLILININHYGGSKIEDLLDQTRFSWRLNRDRARKADYVLSVMRGVAIGAFQASDWHPATKEYFQEISEEIPDRSAFHGKKAPDDIWELYVGERGKRIALDVLKHVQNPIRYWKV